MKSRESQDRVWSMLSREKRANVGKIYQDLIDECAAKYRAGNILEAGVCVEICEAIEKVVGAHNLKPYIRVN